MYRVKILLLDLRKATITVNANLILAGICKLCLVVGVKYRGGNLDRFLLNVHEGNSYHIALDTVGSVSVLLGSMANMIVNNNLLGYFFCDSAGSNAGLPVQWAHCYL